MEHFEARCSSLLQIVYDFHKKQKDFQGFSDKTKGSPSKVYEIFMRFDPRFEGLYKVNKIRKMTFTDAPKGYYHISAKK